MKEEGRGGVSELGSDLDPDPWKILLIWIQQNDVDPLDPDPQHCRRVETGDGSPTSYPKTLALLVLI